MQEANNGPDNPYTAIEGYTVYDASGAGVGEVQSTVYDAPSDVLKYVVLGGRPIPASRIRVDAQERRASVPYDSATIESAPKLEDPSGAFDEAVREHYEGGG